MPSPLACRSWHGLTHVKNVNVITNMTLWGSLWTREAIKDRTAADHYRRTNGIRAADRVADTDAACAIEVSSSSGPGDC